MRTSSFPSHDEICAALKAEDPLFDTRTTLQRCGLAPVEEVSASVSELSPPSGAVIGHPKPSAKVAKTEATPAADKDAEAKADLAKRAVLGKLTPEEKAALIAQGAARAPAAVEVKPKVAAKAVVAKKAAAPKVVLPVIKLEIEKTYRYAGPGPWNGQIVKLLSVAGERAVVSLVSKPSSKSPCKAANLAKAA